MKKYEIRTDSFEFRMGSRRDRIPSMSAEEILDTYLSCDDRITSNSIDPTIEASFDTLEEARAEFARNYAHYGSTDLRRASCGYILTGRLAWIEENEYDENGDFDQGGETYDVSAEPFVSTRYRVRDEYIDRWYGSASTDEISEKQDDGLTSDDIAQLAREWSMDYDDLMEQVEEI